MEFIFSGFSLAEGEGATRTIAVLPEGTWHTDKYGDIDLSAETLDAMLEAFNAGMPPQGVFIDIDHDFGCSYGRVSRLARGTYTDPVTGEELPALCAVVEFTSEGVELIDSGKYGFVSAAFGPYTDVHTGTKYPDVLRTVSLTNSPVLGNLGPVGEGVSIALSEHMTGELGEVLDDMRARRAERTKENPPADLQAAQWGSWDATASFEKLVREAVAEGLTGEELQARIEELAADLPGAVMEAISNAVDEANEREDGGIAEGTTPPQTDPTALADTEDSGDDPVAEWLSDFDALMSRADDMARGTAGVRAMRALASEARKKAAAIMKPPKGGTTDMGDITQEQFEAEKAAKDEALAKLAAIEAEAKTARVATALDALSEKGLVEPARKQLEAILMADDPSAIMLADKTVDMTEAILAFADAVEFVPATTETTEQDAPEHEDDAPTELTAEAIEVARQLGMTPDDFKKEA